MPYITDIKFLSDNMDLVAGTHTVSFHVGCSILPCSLEFCLLLHTVQILSQSLLFGRLLTIFFPVTDFLMAKTFQENISQKMNEFVEKIHPVVAVLPVLSSNLYGLCLQRS